MPPNNNEIEKRLWEAADEMRANSKLKASEYSVPVLGMIFLRYADHKFGHAEKELAGKGTGRRQIGKVDYQARGVLYLPPEARFQNLLLLPEGENIGMAINNAMQAIERENPDLKDVLPKTYNRMENATYADVPGLCMVATLDEIKKQGWSLNPGRYVGVAERLEELNEELETLNIEARELEAQIAENVGKLLEGGGE